MQHLKLSISSLNQSFLYSGNFKEMSYQQLISYAEGRLGRVLPPEFQFFYVNSEGIQFVVNSEEQIQKVKSENQQVIKIILKEKEKEKVYHPNTICSQCHSSPIMNARYKCIVCENREFCENCLDHGQVHPLLIISNPEQEQFFDGFFKTSMNKVKNLFNCQYNLRDAFLKKKSELFGTNQKNHQLQQISLEHKQLQQKQGNQQQIEDEFNNKILNLSEIFEGTPEQFEKIVKQNQHLSLEELVELISDQTQ
ncbi:unnamed protein product (macronuclear) [Paramecium tetraurelia]|uniref:ZZ-type domain-containing protein n=1 Tax=Paramecium tetraurelia TaxID=5888 RepID=A0CAA7_PARTE|nr:uncharacterized protein GSPATT00036504001 [Paramecium tetraurelia]CAK67724.1 unnamed protein product [Paramecium tetraurelia]|eukprot:XP_001435121.1 hypothetical protein (macronuclear) [Paramecium tetraurelia strain d4-2]